MLKETKNFEDFYKQNIFFVSSMVEWLKRRVCNQHGFGSKSTRCGVLRKYTFRHFFLLGGFGKQF